ncbi:hypothetical protein WJX73_004525 [Symbiochloris irregularis]|uniref:Uncharacterized protein n=1 Tax=Symbiochloris irregularis TaxID=706552 RepID=A0AAW1NMJ3_9CHLO
MGAAEPSNDISRLQQGTGWDHQLRIDQGTVSVRGWNADGQADPGKPGESRLNTWTPLGLHEVTSVSAAVR